jgi:hypothetical protein
MDRGNQFVGRKEIKIMLAVLKEEGITLSEIGRTLHTREQPVSHTLVRCLCSRDTFSRLTRCPGFCGTLSTLLKTA